MAKIKNPLQFSHHFEISKIKLSSLGVLDPTLNVDAKLFIDPLLLKVSKHVEMQQADLTYKNFFSEIIKLLQASAKEKDVAWRAAYRKLLFGEINGTCLGYGAASIKGSGFGPKLTNRVTATAKEIIDLGVKDPDLFMALPLLEEDVGPDLISDMTTNIILPNLIQFNNRVLGALDVPREKFLLKGMTAGLTSNPTGKKPEPIILVPIDILRELPVANDWDEVCRIASENVVLRDKINKLIGAIWTAKSRKDKKAIRSSALASYEAFSVLLAAIHEVKPSAYDMTNDPEGVFIWRRIHETVANDFPLSLTKPKTIDLHQVYTVVVEIIKQFQHLIENRGLSKELWYGTNRRNEKSVQRILFAVADSYCKANNLDISPEVDTGTGEIDFKFSKGYESRVLVEIKLSDNSKIVAGYEKQLEAYKKAEKTFMGVYVVIDVGRMGKKNEQILKIKNDRNTKGLPASEVIFIDGSVKPSASKL